MNSPDILTCPKCGCEKHLTTAQTMISFALGFACTKCGASMGSLNGRIPSVSEGMGDSNESQALKAVHSSAA